MKRILGALLVVGVLLSIPSLIIESHRIFTTGSTHDIEVWVPTLAWCFLFLALGLHLVKSKKTNPPESAENTAREVPATEKEEFTTETRERGGAGPF